MKPKLGPIVAILLMIAVHVAGQSNNAFISTNGFKVIPLGVKGGLDESNLSAYLVAASGSAQFICLDAGTIYKGLELAAAKSFLIHPIQVLFNNNRSMGILFLMHI